MGSTTRASRLHVCMAMLAAMFVALGIALAASPTQAYADLTASELAAQAGDPVTVALTVVDEQDNVVVCNEKVDGLTTDNTVADLLAAAGYTKVDTYAGDPKTYVERNNSPYFLGKEFDAATFTFWVTIFNGSSNNYADAFLTSKLKDGGHYQYIYTNRTDPVTFETTFEYTEAIPDPLAVSVALTIVDELGNAVVYNGKVNGLMASDTVADLLAVAGYTKVDAYAGDPKTYVEQYGAPYFLGKEYNPDTWDYWASFFNCKIDATGSEASLSAKLKDGGHYQYVYGQYREEYNYTEAIPDPLTTEVPKAIALLNNLTTRFAKGGAGGKIDNYTYAAAVAISSLGKEYLVDTDSLSAGAEAAVAGDDAGRAAKFALALQAVGLHDAAKDLVGKIDSQLTPVKGDYAFYSLVLILPAYTNTGVIPSGTNYTTDGLIKAIMDQQSESGLFPAQFSGSQETAQAIYALAPYAKDNADIANAVSKAKAAVLKNQDPETGALPPSPWAAGLKMDYDGMGDFIDALALADNLSGKELSPEAAKIADCLVNVADSTLDGYKDAETPNEALTSATVFRGLASAWAMGWNHVSLDNAITSLARAKVSDIDAQTYTGKAIEPTVVVKLDGKELVAGTDYEVACTNNVNVGQASVTITGKGAYTGVLNGTFAINAAPISKATAAKIANATYTGKAITPIVTLTYNGIKLGSSDFSVAYAKNTNAGTATATATGKGNFTGTFAVNFTIDKAAISKAKIAKIKKQKYKKGKAVKPAITVKFNGKKLKKGTDYTVKYKNNKKPGKATATVTGKGNFKGSTKATFKIVK